jgi:hypothetical protein
LLPVDPQTFFAGDGCPADATTLDYSVIGKHLQNRFDVASAIRVEPVTAAAIASNAIFVQAASVGSLFIRY